MTGPSDAAGPSWWRWVAARWGLLPPVVRHVAANVLGWGLILLGLLLAVVPGPFTIPPLLAGLAILATEYRWARRVLAAAMRLTRRTADRARRRLDHPS
jgi:hypothetical protein